MKDKNCIFCKIARGEVRAEIVKTTNNFFAIRDMHPKTNGHTLIIPKKHFVTLLDLPNNLGEELLKFTKEITLKLLEEKYGDGFNILMNKLEPAGQLVKHAHIHILPRKDNDGVKVIA